MNQPTVKTFLPLTAVLIFSVQLVANAREAVLDTVPVIPKLDSNPLAKLFLDQASRHSTGSERVNEWLTSKPLSENLCRVTTLDIASHSPKPIGSPVVPEDSLEIFNLFSQNNKAMGLARAKTYIGQATFAHLLAHPISSPQELAQRQAAVRALVDSPALCRDIHATLSDISKQEPFLLRWRLHQLHGKPKKPYTPALHEIYARMGHALGFVLPVVTTWGVFKLISYDIAHRDHARYRYRDPVAELAAYSICGSLLGTIAAVMDISNLKDWQHLLITYRQFLESATNLYEIVKQKPALKHIPNIQSLCDYFESSETLPLRNFLKKSTFTGSASIFSSAGNINYAQSLLFKTLGHTVRLLQAIGNLDAFLAVARLVSDHQLKDEKYCFINIVEKAHPGYLQLTNAWSPAFKESSLYNFALPNKNALISGVRNSGKTTTAQSICHALMMAQSFGVAPAENCSLLPFSRILMVNVKDDQDLNIPKIFERIENTSIDSSVLVILDVKHRRVTNEELQDAAQRLGKHPQVTTIIVTSNTGLVLGNYEQYEMQELASGAAGSPSASRGSYPQTAERAANPGQNYSLRLK